MNSSLLSSSYSGSLVSAGLDSQDYSSESDFRYTDLVTGYASDPVEVPITGGGALDGRVSRMAVPALERSDDISDKSKLLLLDDPPGPASAPTGLKEQSIDLAEIVDRIDGDHTMDPIEVCQGLREILDQEFLYSAPKQVRSLLQQRGLKIATIADAFVADPDLNPLLEEILSNLEGWSDACGADDFGFNVFKATLSLLEEVRDYRTSTESDGEERALPLDSVQQLGEPKGPSGWLSHWGHSPRLRSDIVQKINDHEIGFGSLGITKEAQLREFLFRASPGITSFEAIKAFAASPELEWILSIKDFCPNLDRLSFGRLAVLDEGLIRLLQAYPHQTTVTLTWHQAVYGKKLIDSGESFPNVKALNLRNSGLQWTELSGVFPGLTKLNITDRGRIVVRMLSEVTFPNLTDFNLNSIEPLSRQSGITDEQLAGLLRIFPRLTNCAVNSREINGSVVAAFSEFSKDLTSLSLGLGGHGLKGVAAEGLTALAAGCLQLENLSLPSCPNRAVEGLRASFPSLTNLDISHGESITGPALKALGRACPNLRHLNLMGRLCGDGLSDLEGAFPELTSLDLTGCMFMTDEELVALIKACPRLIDLNLRGCRELTHTGLEVLAENCSGLECIDIRYSGITGEAWIACEHNFLDLTSLKR